MEEPSIRGPEQVEAGATARSSGYQLWDPTMTADARREGEPGAEA